MSILGIGVDLVDVARIARLQEKHGSHFLRRVFTENEIAACAGRAERLAARFAAKEAVAKAFGTGIGEAMAFAEIEVLNEPSGQPRIRLHGRAAATAAQRRAGGIMLSLSHTHTHAIAQVIVLSRDSRAVPPGQ